MAIQARLQKSVYLIYDGESELGITLELTEDTIQLLNERGKKEFIFKCDNTDEVRLKWRKVLKLMLKATEVPF